MVVNKCDRCGTSIVDAVRCEKCTETKGFKKDGGKPRPALLGAHALEGLGRVLAYGANKYDDDNWRQGMRWRRVADALLRHLLAYLRGEDNDPETGLPHIDHLLCNAMFLSEYFHTKTGVDDRWKGAKNGEPVSQAAVGPPVQPKL
jgi:hypothetical protein